MQKYKSKTVGIASKLELPSVEVTSGAGNENSRSTTLKH